MKNGVRRRTTIVQVAKKNRPKRATTTTVVVRKNKTNKRRSRKRSPSTQNANVGRTIVDPWRFSDCVPDGALGTGCFTIKKTFTLNTGTGGTTTGLVVGANPGTLFNLNAGSTGTTPAYLAGGFWNVSNGAIYTMYKTARCSGIGIKAAYIGSTMNDQGILVAAQYAAGQSPTNQISGFAIDTASSGAMWFKTAPVRDGLQITWRPGDLEDVEAFNPIPQAGATSLVVGTTAPFLWLQAYGVASTTAVLQVEVIWRFSGQFQDQTFQAGNDEGMSRIVDNWYAKAARLYDSIPAIETISNTIMNVGVAMGRNAIQQGLRSSLSVRGQRNLLMN